MTRALDVDSALERLGDYDSPERRADLYAALLESTLYVAVGGDGTVEDAAFALLEDESGKIRIPAFTSELAVQGFLRPHMTSLRLRAPELFQLAVTNQVAAVVINPGSDITLRLLPGELAELAAGRVPQVGGMGLLKQNATGAVRAGPELAESFLLHLSVTLRSVPLVARAFVFRMAPSGDSARTFLGICFNERAEPGDLELALLQIGDRLVTPPEAGSLELVVLQGELLEQVETATSPAYRRESDAS